MLYVCLVFFLQVSDKVVHKSYISNPTTATNLLLLEVINML